MRSKAFEELTVQWTSAQATVGAFIHTLVTNVHDAEEVLQRVAVTLVRKYEQYDARRPFIAWAMGFAKLEVVKHLRERGNQRLVFDNALVAQIAERYQCTTHDDWAASQFIEECVAELDERAPAGHPIAVPRRPADRADCPRNASHRRGGANAPLPGPVAPPPMPGGADRPVERTMSDEPSLLISAYLDGELTGPEEAALLAWLRQDPANVDRFVAECRCHGGLLKIRSHLCTGGNAGLAAAAARENDVSEIIGGGLPGPADAPLAAPLIGDSPPILPPSSSLFPPSGLAVTYSYAIAVVLLGVCVLAAAVWRSPPPPAAQFAQQAPATIQVVKSVAPLPAPRTRVGRITRMIGSPWTNVKSAAAAAGKGWPTVFLGSKYVIAAGAVMEITYDGGARVILKGPSVYEIDGRNGGLLRSGLAVFLCKTGPDEKGATDGPTAARAGRLPPGPKLPPVFCVHTGGTHSFALQDVDLAIQVDRDIVMTRNISSAAMVCDPSMVHKNLALPGRTEVEAWVHRGSQKPLIVGAQPAPAADKKEPVSPETTVYSDNAKGKKPADGEEKGRRHVPDS